MVKRRSILLTVVLVISLLLNCLLVFSLKDDTNNWTDGNGYLEYLVTMRLDRQSNIYYNYSMYLDKLINDDIEIDNFMAYVEGIKIFTHEEMVQGVYNIVFEEDKEMKDLLKSITISNNITKDMLLDLTTEDLIKLKTYYSDLSYIFNRNNKENSITYFISIGEYTSSEFKSVKSKVKGLLDAIDVLYMKQ